MGEVGPGGSLGHEGAGAVAAGPGEGGKPTLAQELVNTLGDRVAVISSVILDCVLIAVIAGINAWVNHWVDGLEPAEGADAFQLEATRWICVIASLGSTLLVLLADLRRTYHRVWRSS